MHHALAVALEASLVVSTFAYGALLVFAMRYKDGIVWDAFRWKAFFGFTGALAGVAVVHYTPFARLADRHPILVFLLVAVIVSRVAQAIASGFLAWHLRNMIIEREEGRE